MRRALLLLPALLVATLTAFPSLVTQAPPTDFCTDSTTGISICPDVFFRDNDVFSEIHFHPGVQLTGPILVDADRFTFDGIGWQAERTPRVAPFLDVNITRWAPQAGLPGGGFTFIGTCAAVCTGYWNLTGLPGRAYEVLVDSDLYGSFNTPEGTLNFSYEFLTSPHTFIIQQVASLGGPGTPQILLTLSPLRYYGWNTVRLTAAAVLQRSEGPVDEELFYRWDLGDGTVTTQPDVTHTFAVDWLWATYPVELRVCTAEEAVCETRLMPLTFFHWPALILIAGGFIILVWLLRRKLRYRIERL